MLLLLLLRVCGMRSLDRPYLAPSSPARPHNPDVLLRLPIYRQRLRTWLSNPLRLVRVRGRMRYEEDGE